ncbi:MAG TPA: sigma-70 family RNA polymerase sigma factor [Ktedonobacteraceae bacterium]
MNSEPEMEPVVAQAQAGNKAALESLISRVQPAVYNLALRMLWHPIDAEDASQEILIKVMTHLSQFRGESSFTTWVYQIATRHLLTTRKRRAELQPLSFEQFGEKLEQQMDETATSFASSQPEQRLLLEEVQFRCTLGMLLCLDREHRLAYILGAILEMDSNQGATITATTPANFRQRLSRARARLRGFMESECGLVDPKNPCRCEKQLGYKVLHEKLASNRLLFAGKPLIPMDGEVDVRKGMLDLQEIDRTVALYRDLPEYAVPETLLEAIKQLLNSGKFEILK